MRVLFLATTFPSPANPAFGIWALRQAQALVRAGIDLRVIRLTPWFPVGLRSLPAVRRVADCPQSHRFGNVDVHYIGWPLYQAGWLKRQSFRNPWIQAKLAYNVAARLLLREMEEFKPELIYAHHTWTSGYVAYRLHEAKGTPYIITDHALDEIEACSRFSQRGDFFSDVQMHAACMVDVAQRMQGIRKRIFPDVKSVVVHNGADPVPENMFRMPRPHEVRDKLVVCCVAGWFTCKGLPRLIEAFGLIAGEFPNAVLRLVGGGPDRPAVMAAIEASPTKRQIQVLGSQPHEQAVQEMCWADVFAMIGKDEAYGVVFTEAMMAGLPLVWPSDCGHNDVLADGVHGIKVPPWGVDATAAALRKLLGDADLRKEIGQANRRFAAEHLTWDANAQSMLVLFREALAKTKSGASAVARWW